MKQSDIHTARPVAHTNRADEVHPFEDESIQGYIARYTQFKDHPTAYWVPDAAKIKLHQAFYSDEEISRLAERTDATFIELRAIAPSIPNGNRSLTTKLLGQEISPTWLVARTERRYCPECLADGAPYHRIIWNFRFQSACSRHKRKLLSECPSCLQTRNWLSTKLTHCKLNHDLRSAVASQVPDEDIAGQRFLEEVLLNPNTVVPLLLHGLNLEGIITVLTWLAMFPIELRRCIFTRPLELGGRELETFAAHLKVVSKIPDPTLGLRLSIGLAMAQTPPQEFEEAIVKLMSIQTVRPKLLGGLVSLKRELDTLESGSGLIGTLLANVLAAHQAHVRMLLK